MDAMPEKDTLAYINRAWESLCRVVLGGPTRPFLEFEAYLSRYADPCHVEKSALSGKPVTVFGNYPKGTRFALDSEMREYEKKFKGKKLNINSIKDIDSAVGAMSEIGIYGGNIVLGKSSFVSQSTRVVDSNFVYRSSDVIYSKNVAFTQIAKYSESVFGCLSCGKGSRFAISGAELYETARHLECYYVYTSSDIHYSGNIENCQECMFSFNLRGKRRCIGNLEFAPDRYLELKTKLLSEARQMLIDKRSLPSIYDILAGR